MISVQIELLGLIDLIILIFSTINLDNVYFFYSPIRLSVIAIKSGADPGKKRVVPGRSLYRATPFFQLKRSVIEKPLF